MRKKKPPYIALTIACLGVAGAFALNLKARPVDPTQPQPQSDAKTPPAESAKDLANRTKTSGEKTKTNKQMQSPGGPKDMSKGPHGEDNFVIASTPKMMKPVKNDNSTNSLWYKN